MKPPKCKTCEEYHWGTCADHGARGALSRRPEATLGADDVHSALTAAKRRADGLASGEIPMRKKRPAAKAKAKRK